MQISFNNYCSSIYDRYYFVLERLTKKTFKNLKCDKNYIIELNFIDNKKIKKINKKFRNINKITDVLSFAFLEQVKNEVKIKSKQPQILGEIDISIEKCISQAKELNHNFVYELVYLYIHGLLHLFGFDHVKNKKDKKIMFDKEDEILKGEDILKNKLVDACIKIIDNSHAIYSHCTIGAALINNKGKIYVGTNIENSSYPLSICAERTAMFNAYVNGENKDSIIELMIYSNVVNPYPCGACRQVMSDLLKQDTKVYVVDKYLNAKIYKVSELLPYRFDLNINL